MRSPSFTTAEEPRPRFIRLISANRTSFALLAALVALVLAYRIRLTYNLFTHPLKPFEFSPTSNPAHFTLGYGYSDLTLIMTFFLSVFLLSQIRFFLKGRSLLLFRVAGLSFLHLLLGAVVFLHLGHFRFLFDAQTGFDFGVILESVYSVSTLDTLELMEIRDCVFALFPLGVFWVVFLIPPAVRAWIARGSLGVMAFWLAFALFPPPEQKNPPPAEIRVNPAVFFISDTAGYVAAASWSKERMTGMVQEAESGIRLTGPLYVHSDRVAKNLPPQSPHPWNVVLLVLESAGTRYMLGGTDQSPVPMPFLNQLAKEGWFLKNHHTTSNVSTKAVFSIYSGLYDFFKRETLGVRENTFIPSLYNFLGPRYDSFLVSPSSSAWYFPLSFLKNDGLPEIHTYENLNFQIREELSTLGRYIARDEIQTVDFFLKRISKAREPFLGMYVSFVAHFPYFDYGPEYRIVENDGRLISRYTNNLYLLDRMIQRIFEHLKKQGLLERTILVVVGDHGQAFGQHHSDNYLHYRYSYRENLEAPVVFYQPALFKPRTFGFPTNHADILPTLLDALRVPYDPALLDGESLFQRKLMRKYIFFYGHEESISSLSMEGMKVQVSLRGNRCWAFNLKTDPEEKNLLDCAPYQVQLEALRNFVRRHDTSLGQYNLENREGRNFQGHRHPQLFQPTKDKGEKGNG